VYYNQIEDKIVRGVIVAKGIWMKIKETTKFSSAEKNNLLNEVRRYIDEYKLLRERTKRVEVKAGRIYLYEFHEIRKNYGELTKPLIDKKYVEMPFARITIYDKKYEDCSAEYQQYNGKWVIMTEGLLGDCIKYIEENGASFY
jgi:predicted nuclease with TOPRIM domain